MKKKARSYTFARLPSPTATKCNKRRLCRRRRGTGRRSPRDLLVTETTITCCVSINFLGKYLSGSACAFPLVKFWLSTAFFRGESSTGRIKRKKGKRKWKRQRMEKLNKIVRFRRVEIGFEMEDCNQEKSVMVFPQLFPPWARQAAQIDVNDQRPLFFDGLVFVEYYDCEGLFTAAAQFRVFWENSSLLRRLKLSVIIVAKRGFMNGVISVGWALCKTMVHSPEFTLN